MSSQAGTANPRTEWAALGGLFSANLTFTALAVAIPTIADDLGGSTSTLVWALSGPIVLRAALGPSIGRLGDLIGRRRMLSAGLATCAVFTVAVGLAPSALLLVVARLLASLGAAVIGPMGVAVLSEGVTSERRARAMGRFAMVAAGSPALGLVLAGPIVDILGWRWMFLGQSVLIAGFAALAATTVAQDVRRPFDGFDLGGAVLLAGGLGLALAAVSQVSGSGGPRVAVPAAIGCFVLLRLFWRRQLSHPTPLIPVRSFGKRAFMLPAGLLALSGFGYMGGFILTPLLLQDVFGLSATRTGLLSITRPMAFAVAGPVAGRILPRVGPRRVVAMGTASVAASLCVLAAAAVAGSEALVLIALAMSGIGQGAALTSVSSAIADAVDESELGVAAATQQTTEMMGVSVGIQTLASVADSGGSDDSAFAFAYLVGAVSAAAAALVAVFVRWGGPDARSDDPVLLPTAS